MWKALALLLPAVICTAAYGQAATTDSASYSEQIEQQSAQLGPFDPSLVELYQQYGSELSRQGDFLQAARALQLALQISRVNFGPLTPQQEPALRGLIDLAEASGENEQAELFHQRLVDINNNQLNTTLTIDDVDALLRSSQWHLDRYNSLPFSTRLTNLQLALRLATHSESIVSAHYHKQHTALIEPLKQIALSSYHLTEQNLSVLRFFGNEQGSFHQQLTEQQFQQGLKAHRQVVEILRHNEAPAETLAQAQIDLGDYLQRLQLPQASRKVYQRAWKTLHSADRNDQLAGWLGQPTPLFSQSHNNVSEASSLARIKAHVDTLGKVERVEVLQTYPADDKQVVSAAQLAAQRLPFRLAVVDGEVVPGTVEFNLPLFAPAATP